MANSATVTVTVTKPKPSITVTPALDTTPDIIEQRLQCFLQQERHVQNFYHLYQNANEYINTNLFYIASKKSQYVETAKFAVAKHLNARETASLDLIEPLFDNLYMVDDLLMSVMANLSHHRPIGWQMVSQSLNLLNLPTVGQLRPPNEPRSLEASVASTVLQFFGVASYTLDRGYFIGHILGYLFCCYYFAHLGIAYSVTALTEKVAGAYAYQTVNVPELVRLLQEVDESLKKQVYQLAVFTAQMSEYNIDKRIERMLITEVNSFDKQALRDELSQEITYGSITPAPLFQGLKPIR